MRGTPKQAVCMFFSGVSADNHQGRRDGFYKGGSAILYPPPAVSNTWWNHSVETLEESVEFALEGTRRQRRSRRSRWKGGDNKTGDLNNGVRIR